MRKIIISNLLLIMFLVGAASGFLVSTIGWWSLYQGAQDLDRLYGNSAVSLKQVSDVETLLQSSQTLFLDALRKQQSSAADMSALVRSEDEMRQELSKLLQDPKSDEYWTEISHIAGLLSNSRARVLDLLETDASGAFWIYVADTAPLTNRLFASLHRFLPQVTGAMKHTYEEGTEFNRNARNLLLGMSLLASVFFCLAAWLTCRETMERRRKSAQLDREHTLFKTLFESTGDGVILRSMGRVIDCNHAALKMFSVPTVQAFADLETRQPQCDGNPLSESLLFKIEETLALGSQRFEWQFTSMKGKEFPAEVAIDTAHLSDRDIIQLTIRDISAKVETERSIRLANQAFENSLEGIVMTSADGSILTVNKAFTAITGYSRDEVAGRNPGLLSSGRQTPEFYKEMWSSIDQTGKWQGEIWNIRKNGDIYPQWLNISRVADEDGTVTNFVGVFSDISERKGAEERILHQVYYDQLTDLPNRVLFTDRLIHLLGMTKRRPDAHFAVMFLDLDRFKLINDSLGHNAGDLVLQQAATRMRGSVRDSDTVARMGGDEFTILLSEITDPTHAANVAQKILGAFRPPFLINEEEVYVSVSIGVSVYPEDGNTTEILLKNADTAMYRAKGAGGSWYELYAQCLGTQSTHRLVLETALHKALERNELKLHYQPQFDCDSGRMIGYEALLRWQHPERGLLTPDAFLAIAEETGMIVPIGEWILRTACAQAKAWESAGMPMRVAVNLSARQFHRGDLAEVVSAILEELKLPPRLLEIELTEGILMEDSTKTGMVLDKLHRMGVQISIDDFGTGYSSLSYLKRLPIQILKIDQSFVRDIHTDPDDRAIVIAVIALAHSMKLKVVAEGVETLEQLAFLREYRCDAIQGYLLSRPVLPDEVLSLMRADKRLPA